MEKQKRQKHNRPLAREVLRNTIYNNLQKIVSSFGGIIFSILAARMLKPELFGVYGLTISIVSIIIAFSNLGFKEAITRWVAYALGRNDKKLVRSYFKILLKYNTMVILGISLISFFLSDKIAEIFSIPLLSFSIKIMSVYIFLVGIYGIISSAFFGLRDFKDPAIFWIIFNIMRIVSMVLLVFMFSLSLLGVFMSLIVGVLSGLLFLFAVIWKKYLFLIAGKVKKIGREKKGELKNFIFHTASLSLTGIIFTNIDVIMIGYFLGSVEVGLYKVAQSMIITLAGIGGLSVVIFPVLSSLDSNKFREVFKKTFRYSAIISFPMLFGTIWAAGPLIKILYGKEYVGATLPLLVLSFMLITSTTLGLFDTIFVSRGIPKYSAIIKYISLTLNIFLNYLLIT
ncbi:MAG: flippase, partial [Candidatus Aenigmarchaeota archaeon]|nr:flippase [Candidatus Aenigmarchaeota archaeon]